MAKVVASIATSVDGSIAGPDDGPGKGLGEGGERLHHRGVRRPVGLRGRAARRPSRRGRKWLAEVSSRIGAVVGGRGTYEAARHRGDENPWGLPFLIVTHRPDEQPADDAFAFVAGVEPAVEQALDAAGGKDVKRHG